MMAGNAATDTRPASNNGHYFKGSLTGLSRSVDHLSSGRHGASSGSSLSRSRPTSSRDWAMFSAWYSSS